MFLVQIFTRNPHVFGRQGRLLWRFRLGLDTEAHATRQVAYVYRSIGRFFGKTLCDSTFPIAGKLFTRLVELMTQFDHSRRTLRANTRFHIHALKHALAREQLKQSRANRINIVAYRRRCAPQHLRTRVA